MEQLKQAVERAMRRAGDQLLTQRDFTVHTKADDHDFVTDMDVRMQEELRISLGEALPEAAFLSEEDLSQQPASGQLYWLVDPIDGTTNFVRDLHLSCLSAALCRDGKAVAGAVYCPWSGEFFWAEEGRGASCNGQPIHVSDKTLPQALMCFGQGYGARAFTLGKLYPLIEKCYIECVNVRALGVAELTLCYVAAGRVDGYFEYAIMPWDYAAGGLILREAGGVCTTWRGELPSLAHEDSLLACNPACHQALQPLAHAAFSAEHALCAPQNDN